VLSKLYGQHVDVIHVHGRVLVVAGRGDGLDLPGGPHSADCDGAHDGTAVRVVHD
jgi:zinc/manganese transport system ATP-binding protein